MFPGFFPFAEAAISCPPADPSIIGSISEKISARFILSLRYDFILPEILNDFFLGAATIAISEPILKRFLATDASNDPACVNETIISLILYDFNLLTALRFAIFSDISIFVFRSSMISLNSLPDFSRSSISVFKTFMSAPEQIKPMIIPENKNVVLLDHHIPGNLIKISKNYVDPNAKSCSEIIYELSKYFSDLSERSAFLLASGIVYDTAHLRNADIKVLKTLIELLEKSGKEFKEIIELLNTNIDISEKIANLKAVSRLKSYRINDIIVSFTHAGSFEASVARNLLRMGSDIAIVAAPRKKSLRISGRMKSYLRDKINLAEIFSEIEPIIDGSAGGHDMAASANGKNPGNIGKAFDKILISIEKKIGENAKKL